LAQFKERLPKEKPIIINIVFEIYREDCKNVIKVLMFILIDWYKRGPKEWRG
jgi:hypothetical protein